MSTSKTAPDFREPWDASAEYVYGRDDKEVHLYPHRLRIAQCVNACAGMSDPAAEIQALRDAAASACEFLQGIEEHLDGNRGMFVQAAIAELQSIL